MKKFLLSLLVGFTMFFGASGLAYAAPPTGPTDAAQQEVCKGISGQVGGTCTGGANSINDVMEAVLQIISVIAGFAAVVMIVIAGLKYITSGGDSNSISSAKSTLIYALVGVIVVVLAQSLVLFVLGGAIPNPPAPAPTP